VTKFRNYSKYTTYKVIKVLNTNNFTVERNKGSDFFDNLKTREPGFRGDGGGP